MNPEKKDPSVGTQPQGSAPEPHYSKSVQRHLVSCPSCGRAVLDHMTVCPFCGGGLTPCFYVQQDPARWKLVRRIALIVGIVAAVAVVAVLLVRRFA